jgi:transcriptional regulator with XRE-family HTH domain
MRWLRCGAALWRIAHPERPEAAINVFLRRTSGRNKVGQYSAGNRHFGLSIMKSPTLVDRHVGGRVRSRRVALGMSPKNLADALGTSVQQVQQWEAGTSRIGSTRLMELTIILGVNAAFFFADSEPNEPIGEAGSIETLSSQSIPGSTPSLETLRLIRAFAGIKNRAFREVIVKLVETMAKTENGKLDDA